MPLYTERLVLRGFRLADAPLIAEMVALREVAEGTLNIPHPYLPEMAEQWVAGHPTAAKDDVYNFAITRVSDGLLIGSIVISVAPRFQRAEIGYWLGLTYWNQGYTTEAARAVLHWGFTQLGLHKMCASHFPANPASGRVMQKLGMQYEGTLRQHVRRDGEPFVDLIMYGVLREEFLR
ncbi:GNAT family N-acetyltransferase [Candidatus Gracilibacteria bacterium]|nr:GNAT family N-acetyltransferase [Candidatus Gracilibacteria bacterium]